MSVQTTCAQCGIVGWFRSERVYIRDRAFIEYYDLALPRVSGLDVQREIAGGSDTRDIPIVVVTGTSTEHLNEADSAFVLKKPIDPQKLIYCVESA